MIEYAWRHIIVREYPENHVITVGSSSDGADFTLHRTIDAAVAAFKARMYR